MPNPVFLSGKTVATYTQNCVYRGKKQGNPPLYLALTNLLLTCLLLSNRAQNAGEKSKIFSRLCAQLLSDAGTPGFQGNFLNLEHSERKKNGIKD